MVDMKNFPILAIAALSLFLLLAGCAESPQPSPPSAANLSSAHNAFGFSLFGQMLKSGSGENTVISPTSISFALSMAQAGAAGETRAAMANTLGFGNLSQGEINNGSRYLIYSLGSRAGVELSVANSIWLDKSIALNGGYQGDMETYYGAKAATLDFSSQSAADTINGWVSGKTNGKIPSIVDSSQLAGSSAVLANAVYFKGKWATPFKKEETQGRNFTKADGSESEVPMMQQSGEYDYLETADFQAVRLPYGNNSASMYVFLPKTSLLPGKIEDFAGSIDSAKWGGWMSGFSSREGTVILPKFKTEYSASLKEPLIASGMGVAFSDSADFSGMSATPLKISDVLHKTYVETDEEGTEAAAATAVIMRATAMAPGSGPQPFYMEVNHPFFFAITDDQTGEILFMGVMNSIGN